MKAGEEWFFRKGWPDGARLDAAEIPNDPAMPQLARMLDPARMDKVFRGVIDLQRAGKNFEIEGSRIASVSYRPGRECRVNYAIDLRNVKAGRHKRGYVYAKILSGRRSERILGDRLDAAARRGVKYLFDEESQAVAAMFPDDTRIHGLGQFALRRGFDDAAKAAMGNIMLAERSDTDGHAPFEIVRYRPERHCLFRCWLKPADGPVFPAYARIYRDRRGAHVHSLMERLWTSPQRQSGALNVARPLGYSAGHQALFQAALPGQSLEVPTGGIDMQQEASRTGAALALLHSIPVSAAWELEADAAPSEEIAWLRKNARGLADVDSGLAERLLAAVDALERTASCVDSGQRVLVHGDFSIKQMLSGDGPLGIIDFDDASWGNPYADLGSFLARLQGVIDQGIVSPAAAQSFKHGYQNQSGAELDDRKLGWSTALGFVRSGISKLAHLQPGWAGSASKAFERAREIVRSAVLYLTYLNALIPAI